MEIRIQVLKRRLQQDGLYHELRQRRFHEKPGIKSRRKAEDAQRRLRKKQKRLQQR